MNIAFQRVFKQVYSAMLKRCFDFTAALFLITLTWPVLLLLTLIIRLDSPGPIFYRGVRTGIYGRPFRIFKFRTMVIDAEKLGGPSTAANDPRLTAVGRVVRKYKFDELPQFFNILKGEMSFVGPRPQVEQYTKLYSEKERVILTVKPGLTDYASIRFINLDEILGDGDVDEKYQKEIEPEKNRLRIKYAEKNSFAIDMKILFMTLLQMLGIRLEWNIKH